MSWPEILMWAVVLCIGLPSVARNITSLGLVISWAAGQMTWMLTGDNLPIAVYVAMDAFVITIIYIKAAAYDCYPYSSLVDQLCAFWLEKSWWDRIVLAIFPVMWALYAAPISDFHRWWALWMLVIVQFLVSGSEALENHRSRRAANADGMDSPDNPSSGVAFALARVRRSYG